MNYFMSNIIKTGVPWVEKHRPSTMDNIVLDEINKEILENILKSNYFPNLLLHGPPGTGKTTTIINLVKEYQMQNNELNKGLMIHLNASDDRGIDTIRSQISQFVGTQGLFSQGLKFVILDEVDYMTKTAQQALRCLLNSHKGNVRFCLICNYISRIDESLQNDFIRLRFNQLPEDKIIYFLTTIAKSEKLDLNKEILNSIQQLYKSDIRSMINCLQSQQNVKQVAQIITKSVWIKLLSDFEKIDDLDTIYKLIIQISEDYRINYNAIIKLFLNYIVRNRNDLVSDKFLDMTENLLHLKEGNQEINVMYLICSMKELVASHNSNSIVQ
jgi:DNA polymerase III delta prime subunit